MAYCCCGEEDNKDDIASQTRVITVQLEAARVRIVLGHGGGRVGTWEVGVSLSVCCRRGISRGLATE